MYFGDRKLVSLSPHYYGKKVLLSEILAQQAADLAEHEEWDDLPSVLDSLFKLEPGNAEGWFFKALYLEQNGNKGGVLVGLLLNTGNFHQRRKDALREAQKNPDIKAIVDNLKKVKTLKSNEPVLTPSADFVIQKNTKAILVRG